MQNELYDSIVGDTLAYYWMAFFRRQSADVSARLGRWRMRIGRVRCRRAQVGIETVCPGNRVA
jgi:hypothetical protein